MSVFTIRTNSQDQFALRECLYDNVYRLPDTFKPTDVIVDIGANVGAFAYACLIRGAGKVLCYEPDAENCKMLRLNLAQFKPGSYWTDNVAVWRSDKKEAVGLYNAGDYTAQHVTLPKSVLADTRDVQTLSLDTILASIGVVRLLKLDCEGSEFAILYTSKLLKKCEYIVGEYHGRLHHAKDTGEGNGKALARHLESNGFVVDLKPADRKQKSGLFFAARK